MAWVAVDMDNTEWIFNKKPFRSDDGYWYSDSHFIYIPRAVLKSSSEENYFGKMSQ